MGKPSIKHLESIVAGQRADLKKMHFTVEAYKKHIRELGGDPDFIKKNAAAKRYQRLTSKEAEE